MIGPEREEAHGELGKGRPNATGHGGDGSNRQHDDTTRKLRPAFYATDPSAQAASWELWVHDNPKGAELFERLMLREVMANRKVGARWAFEEVRRGPATDRRGDPFKVNNNMVPAAARWFIRRHPEYAALVETRKAECEWAFEGDAEATEGVANV